MTLLVLNHDGDDASFGIGIVPNVGDIGDRLSLRTIDRKMNELGTFTEDTTPTADRVLRLITKSVGHVTGRLGPDIPDRYERDIRDMIEIYTAMTIELSHYPDQVRAGRSPYKELKQLYDDGMSSLMTSIFGSMDGSSFMPSYGFPPTSVGDGVMP